MKCVRVAILGVCLVGACFGGELKFDEKKFEDACARANRTAAAWLKSCKYMGYKPSPLSGFD